MVCLGLEPGVVRWKAQMNPLSYCCTHPINGFFLKNVPTPASFRLFLVFSNKQHYNFYNKYMWKKCPSSIRCQDSNPRPSERESLPITTRPGLPPMRRHFKYRLFCHYNKYCRNCSWQESNLGPLSLKFTSRTTKPLPTNDSRLCAKRKENWPILCFSMRYGKQTKQNQLFYNFTTFTRLPIK